MALRPGWLLAFALSACGKGEVGVHGPDAGTEGDGGSGEDAALSCVGTSGSRLRQLVRDHEDGSSEVVSLIDSEWDLECTFQTAADGQPRCLPYADQVKVYSGVVRYRDAACTQPIGSVPPGVTPVLYRDHVLDGEGCARRQLPVHAEVGAVTAIGEGDTIHARDGDGDCVAQAAEARTYFDLGPTIPPDRFVAGSESWTDAGRLSLRRIESEDGARFCDMDGQLRDGERDGSSCQLQWVEGDSIRCLPGMGALVEYFSDDECTAALELAQSDSCGASEYVAVHPDEECLDDQQVHQVGDRVTTQLYWNPGGTCSTFDPGPTARFHLPGPVVAPDTFAELRREYVDGGTRLQRGDLVGDGVRLHRARWKDTALDLMCGFRAGADGVPRCFPTQDATESSRSIAAATRYTDDECTVGVLVAWYQPGCGDDRPRFIHETTEAGIAIHEVGADHPGPFFQIEAAGCVPAPSGDVHVRLGAEVDPAMFASGVERLE